MSLYPASFPVPTFVQFFYSFQGVVAGSLGLVGFFYPNAPSITLGGYWEYIGEDPTGKSSAKEKKVVLAPNVRGWALRNGLAAVVNVMGLYFGTPECYYIICAVSIWREFFDILEAFIDGDTDKVFFPAKIAPGKFPPLLYFPPWASLMVGNLASLYMVYAADQ
mmetsp:Transcript_12300/g.34110  ORF Transcript_12300/g.34110 Transcript_12300/m.34110 type:complete len:164 (+) Transcript_12300:175-666(+)|eukprot:CAMPEP_0168780762 /NCGR_PEP_ID=MMETSP0725-20121227/8286_1 /TAXON_ID=265536 /ORGANISM="Amphiprora sp., Strain CCMP467" /LENGTH=163 /DNA_ID=CAMNT_0008830615 /DNA_START=83 /DNA_END=574 /DNA_ORIENTATION=-